MVIGEGEALDEDGFGAGGGAVFLDEVMREAAEFFAGFAGAADVFGAEAVSEGVAIAFLFAFFGFGSGGKLGVAAIGGDLRFGRHTPGT